MKYAERNRLKVMACEMYHADSEITHKQIAKHLGLHDKTVVNAIVKTGVRHRDIYQRQKDRWLRKNRETLTVDEDGNIARCEQCLIFMIEDKNIIPDMWAWDINGRIGDICRACEKEMNASQKKRMARLREIGCIVCRIETGLYVEPEIHHLRDGLGVGQRKNHYRTIPLCPEHHRLGGYGIARHNSLREWEDRHGSESELLDIVNLGVEPSLCGK